MFGNFNGDDKYEQGGWFWLIFHSLLYIVTFLWWWPMLVVHYVQKMFVRLYFLHPSSIFIRMTICLMANGITDPNAVQVRVHQTGHIFLFHGIAALDLDSLDRTAGSSGLFLVPSRQGDLAIHWGQDEIQTSTRFTLLSCQQVIGPFDGKEGTVKIEFRIVGSDHFFGTVLGYIWIKPLLRIALKNDKWLPCSSANLKRFLLNWIITPPLFQSLNQWIEVGEIGNCQGVASARVVDLVGQAVDQGFRLTIYRHAATEHTVPIRNFLPRHGHHAMVAIKNNGYNM